ncbi:ScbA/BarX family gamma-butyrolactone biosynthesis protein [Kitasatospora sp. NPDC057223]|uniref:ScbA/BarX family gamma-butyrolactone biosynthesis protein n=1 Tax=Kitasatospora sp. NPDC057223 TaxID=3346055 RepID=UPI00362EFBC8
MFTVLPATGSHHPTGTSSAPADPWGGLSFGRRVAREAVHKVSATEVLLTDARRLDTDRFAVAALWSRNHLLRNRADASSSDPLLLAETVRQTAILLSHRFHGIPDDFPFVMFDLELAVAPGGLPAGPGPLPIVLDTVCVHERAAPGRFKMHLEAEIHVAGVRCGRVAVSWEAMHPRRYGALRYRRGRRPEAVFHDRTPPLPAAAVGYRTAQDVLLAAGRPAAPQRWQLRMDRSHPVLFDHDSDHIPGMVLLEAFRQAARLTTTAGGGCSTSPDGWSPSLVAIRFSSFGELDLPVSIETALEPAGAEHSVLATAVQDGRVLASARLLAMPPAHRGRPQAAAKQPENATC